MSGGFSIKITLFGENYRTVSDALREALNKSHAGATGLCGMRCAKGDNANG